MKKIMTLAAIAIFGIANAQKGTVLVGGNIDITTQKTGDQKNNSFEFNPKLGYQFTDHWTAGVESSIGTQKQTTPNFLLGGAALETKTNNLSIGGFVRYAQSLGGVFAAYADLGAGFKNAKESNNIAGSQDIKSNGYYVNLKPALFINFKNSFGLNFGIGGISYDQMKDKSSSVKTNNFNFNFGKEVSVGISKNF